VARQCWVGVVSREHVQRGVAGGFVQLNHGKRAPLQRMRGGDGVALYSPRDSYPDGAPLQHFTAIGVVVTGEVYQLGTADDFRPYRVDVAFCAATEAPIRPLIERLSFIRDKRRWSAPFRFGYLKVPEADFATIARAMAVEDQTRGHGAGVD
jgi:EVE domain